MDKDSDKDDKDRIDAIERAERELLSDDMFDRVAGYGLPVKNDAVFIVDSVCPVNGLEEKFPFIIDSDAVRIAYTNKPRCKNSRITHMMVNVPADIRIYTRIIAVCKVCGMKYTEEDVANAPVYRHKKIKPKEVVVEKAEGSDVNMMALVNDDDCETANLIWVFIMVLCIIISAVIVF